MDGKRLRTYRTQYGLTQAAVAARAGMRQPDIAALESGRRTSAEALRRARDAVVSLARPSTGLADPEIRARLRAVLEAAGATDIRVFGSVASGSDAPGSDVDLIARFPETTDLFDVMRVEEELEDILGVPVDVVSDDPEVDYALLDAKSQAVPL
ncbi:nucleotidyltransferase domain-containing protein [Nocardioides ferulae]|uniref:nucleotidyltransferase domain-containing protein n=1 Tax=Nocardioides ferulae TaxID=2340821 RepID=UPI00197D6080|nr:XRE family transcriptional regulator [Nocardioides ferulae]